MKHSFKKEFRRFLCFLMTFIMILTSMPVHLLASYDYKNLSNDKSKIINKIENVEVAKPDTGKTAADLIENPKQPDIYTLRTDFKAEKGEGYKVNYQPYVATVGAAASDAEKAKVNRDIKLPDMAGYDKPVGEDILKIKYDNIVKSATATDGHKTGNEKNGYKFLKIKDKNYKAKTNSVVIKHVFQDMHDFNKFTNGKSNTITEEKTEKKEVDGETKYEKKGLVYKKKDDNTYDLSDPYKTYDLSDPDQKAEFLNYEVTTTNSGNTGSTLEVQALPESQRPGYVPQVDKLKTQVPEDTSEFKIEYRYNRAHYNVVFDTQDGTPLPTRSYYYEQEIPSIDENSIPKKEGCEFLGWKPSHDLEGMLDGKKHIFKKNEIIKDANRNAIVDLGNTFYKKDKNGKFIKEDGNSIKGKNTKDIQLKMPALKLGDGKNIPREKLTFTAVWKDKEKADFAVQFWAEKADHADNAPMLEKYEFMGTKVYKDIDVGFQPYLKDMPINGIVFPDLDQKRLKKIWAGEKFYADRYLYLNKFFVYNKDLTDEQNKDTNNPSVVKRVSATGETVYNIYYDRQVYDLYFTKSNALPAENTFYPSIYVPDGDGGAKLAGGPGNPYHYKARFNQLMLGWPNDAMQTKGFDEGKQSYGWGPNYGVPNFPLHLDTPPYRLNADEFLDMSNYDNWGGYVSKIDKGDGTYIDVYNDPRYKDAPYKALSFGIKQDKGSMPHHMDFWMDGFKPKETIIRYDLYRFKADTNSLDYGHKYSHVQGFTPYGTTIEEGREEHGRITEDDIDTLNEKRGEITPYPDVDYTDTFGFNNALGQMHFRAAFFNNADEFGDPLTDEDGNYIVPPFKTNGYIRFKYKRNKYPLRFNYDPSVIKDDNEFGSTNSLDTFYEFPLACLSPDLVDDNAEREDKEYFKEKPKSLIDIPENLQKMGLTELVEKDKNGKLKIKRPEGVSDQSVFKGWALDPAGTKLVWKNKAETMPTHALNLYAIWGEPDYKWKVTIDPNGGTLPVISAGKLTTEKKTIKEGEGENEKEVTYPVVGYEGKNKPTDDEDKDKANPQVFTVVQRQKLNNLPKPERYGYDFLGWEVVRYKKDKNDSEKYTNEVDNEYRTRYKVPELYTFGEDVVSPITLKAIWVENKRADVKVKHYKLTKDFKFDEKIYPNPQVNTLEYKRVGDYVPTTGEKQDENWILATHEELMEKLPKDLKDKYIEYNNRVKMNNTFFQTFQVLDNIKGGTKDNPVYTPNPENEFIFFYRPFRTRDYTVNYLDERGKKEVEAFYKGLDLIDTADLTGDELLEAQKANKKKFDAKKSELDEIIKKHKIVDPEDVSNGNRHFDARNYRQIPGWTLTSNPQQQLFFDVNEDTNEFLGINGTGGDQIFFYYKDVRVIEVPGNVDPPKDYVRVTFKIDEKDKGGVFKDKDGNEVTELHYDVIKGLKSDLLPHPIIWEEGKKDSEGKLLEKEKNRYYITPDTGKSFKGWDNDKWLNESTEINKNYTFTAYFEWSGLTASGLVRTEAFKDPKPIKENPADPTIKAKDWTNNFAPTIDQLKAQLVWREKGEVKPLPAGTVIKLFDEAGNELTTDDQVYALVNEKKAADKDELVRTVNVKAKVTFTDGKEPQELDIPITVYKNVYEALTGTEKPLFLSQAEGKDAKDGGLKDILKDTATKAYVKVTVAPTGDLKSKDNKVYYVNPKAWVVIPEVDTKDNPNFTNWTADKKAQNEKSEENGVYDFGKRHKFTEDTVISPGFAEDVVEQKDKDKKPNVPDSYVKVIVDLTDKAKLENSQPQKLTFWVNPTKEVAITVANPNGKTDQEVDLPKLGKKKVNYVFDKWQKVQTGKADDKLTEVKPAVKIDLAKNKYTDKVTVIEAVYNERFAATPIVKPIKTEELHTPEGKEITDEILKGKITPPANKEIESITVVEKPDPSKPGKQEAKVTIKYKDGSTQGTKDNPVVIPVEVHKNIIPEAPGGQKPKDAMDNYVKVIFKAGNGGTLSGDLVYYVSPEVEVDMTESAKAITKKPDTGYFVNGEKWTNKDKKALKGTFTDKETEFVFEFGKSDDIVEKTNDPSQVIPKDYVKVTFKTEDKNKGKLEGDKLEKIYYVNPKAEIKLVELQKGQTAGEKQLAVPKTVPATNYEFDKWYEEIDTETEITSERIHVAKFKLSKVTLTYEAGEGAKGEVPAKVEVDHGTNVRLARPDGLSKDNATFAGWKIGEKTYQPGDQVTLNENTTATAQWTSAKHTVKFVFADGTQFDQKEVEHGKTATKPTKDPTLAGKVFMGWKEKESDTSYFDFNTPITADKTLMAIWQDSVQKIGENDKVEEQFIKVTFHEGEHGKLKLADAEQTNPVTYKVAKGYNFDQAVKAGLKVPEIVPAKYYKSVDKNSGWDKELKLNRQNVEFTAQYQQQADVIPVDPKVTPDDKLQEDKPEGMVLVEFFVPNDKAYMDTTSKFYVAKEKLVSIKAPVVYNTVDTYEFTEWQGKTLQEGMLIESYTEDAQIYANGVEIPEMEIALPQAGDKIVKVIKNSDGATGKLVVIVNGEETVLESKEITTKRRKGRRFVTEKTVYFELPQAVQFGDSIKYWAEKDGVKSPIKYYTVE